MKRAVSVLAWSVLAAGLVQASTPVMFSPRSGPPRPGGEDEEACWSQTFDLNGNKISSEIIGAFDLESELADDFRIPAGSGQIARVVGWGGPYNWAPGDPDVTAFNLYFYDDGGCVPANRIQTYLAQTGSVTFIGYDGFGFPTYQCAFDVAVTVVPDTIYWWSLQAADHVFPPQWGRQQAHSVMQCDAMFRSEFFSYPDWTPADVIGPFDCSQEIWCAEPVAVEPTTWGTVKGLYR